MESMEGHDASRPMSLRVLNKFAAFHSPIKLPNCRRMRMACSERSSESDRADPESKCISTPPANEEFDVDSLFSGLLER